MRGFSELADGPCLKRIAVCERAGAGRTALVVVHPLAPGLCPAAAGHAGPVQAVGLSRVTGTCRGLTQIAV